MSTEPTGRGVQAVLADQFDAWAALGGARGLIESVLPGALFVVVFVASRNLTAALVASAAVALVAVLARLIQRTPATQALAGVGGVAIGVIWAWRTGDASDYFAWGLYVNAAYLAASVITILAGWPLVGVVVEALRNLGREDTSWTAWRQDRAAISRYRVATWLWAGMFAARLAVQVPLYLTGEQAVGWLGTARLAMGLPLWALVLWLTWLLVRQPATDADPPANAPAQ